MSTWHTLAQRLHPIQRLSSKRSGLALQGTSDTVNLFYLTESAERMRSQLTIFSYRYGQKPEIEMTIQEEHEEIFRVYKSGDFAAAALRMKEHLHASLSHALSLL